MSSTGAMGSSMVSTCGGGDKMSTSEQMAESVPFPGGRLSCQGGNDSGFRLERPGSNNLLTNPFSRARGLGLQCKKCHFSEDVFICPSECFHMCVCVCVWVQESDCEYVCSCMFWLTGSPRGVQQSTLRLGKPWVRLFFIIKAKQYTWVCHIPQQQSILEKISFSENKATYKKMA